MRSHHRPGGLGGAHGAETGRGRETGARAAGINEQLGKGLAGLPGQVGELLPDIGNWNKAHADGGLVAISSAVGLGAWGTTG
ncbi:hypothetical protein [Streptomyces sp. enrichment culture]|uniref:hypothetical protein n=1 Tax=Streptomyces sp. enrichment culture TaxID=1795815 RepID=UPI003F578CFF